MSLQRTYDILNSNESAFTHFYLECTKNTAKFYPWKNDNPDLGLIFSDLISAIEGGIPFKSDDKYTCVDLFNILYDRNNGWKLAKLYFCAKREPSSSFLKLLPLDVFKDIFYFIYPRKRMDIFLEIVSDIHLFVPCARPIFYDEPIITSILCDEDIHNKYKFVLARNIKKLLSQSNYQRLKDHFQQELQECDNLVKNEKTKEYEYRPTKPIKEENSKKKQKTK